MMRLFVSIVLLVAITVCGGDNRVVPSESVVYLHDYSVAQAKREIFTKKSRRFKVKPKYLGELLQWDRETRTMSFQCKDLFSYLTKSISGTWPPPINLPSDLWRAYTLDNRAKFLHQYYSQQQNGKEDVEVWSESYLDLFLTTENTCGLYRQPHCAWAMERFKHFIENKVGLVLGTQYPWAEAALLNTGAKHVITMEYAPIWAESERLTAITPSALAQQYLQGIRKHSFHTNWILGLNSIFSILLGSFEQVDFIFSFSSIEHDGLGRYGDPLSPSADLESIARMHCLLKDNGIFFLAVPVGEDAVVWNAHRIYGKYRLSLALANWEIVDVIGMRWAINDRNHTFDSENQPIWVLRKIPMDGEEL